MDLRARGAYITLLCSAWIHGSIPRDFEKLARLCNVSRSEFETDIWPQIADCFAISGSSRLINEDLENQRQKQHEYRKQQAEKGRKGAIKRWGDIESNSNGHSPAIAKAIAPATERPKPKGSSSSSSPSSIEDIDIDGKRFNTENPEIKQILFDLKARFNISKHDTDSFRRQIRKHGYDLVRVRNAYSALCDKKANGDLREPAKYFQRVLKNGALETSGIGG